MFDCQCSANVQVKLHGGNAPETVREGKSSNEATDF